MANDIKQKIVLEGEKEYNRALAEAKRNLKTLRSELKAETAELGANATAQQKNEAKIKSLQKQIKEQEKIVRTYQDALKEVREKYGDNADAVAKWEVKLNEARTTLANMKNSLDGVGEGFKGIQDSASMATVATKSVADSLDKLSGIGSAISDGIEAAFTGLLSTAKQNITSVWNEIVDLAARSNNLTDLAGFWNTDVSNIQKYAYAVSFASGNLEDLNALVTKIVMAADKDKKGILAGVSLENYNDQWDYAMAVMDALHNMDDGNEKRKTAEDIFGKSFTKALDLINDWDKVLENLEWGESDVYGMSNEEIQQMSDLYDKVNGIAASWKYLKDKATVKLFGDLAFDITSNAQSTLDALMHYMNADSDEERDAALKEIEDNILAMFERAKKAIEDGIKLLDQIAEDLKNSDNPTAQALGNLLSGLVDALKWLTEDNMKNVVKALEVLAAFWITGKGLQMGTKIASIVKDIMVIKSFGTGSAAAGAGSAAAGGAASAGGATAGGAATAGGGWLAGMGAKLAGGAKTVGSAVGGLGMLVGPFLMAGGLIYDTQRQIAENNRLAEEERKRLEEQTENFASIGKLADAGYAELWGSVKSPWSENTLNPMAEWAERYKPWWYDDQKDSMMDTLIEALDDDTWDELVKVFDAYNNGEGYYGDIAGLYEKIRKMVEEYEPISTNPDWASRNGGNAGNTDGLTSADARNMAGAVQQMPGAVARSLSGMRVTLDGATVGRLVAPYVSQEIAHSIV